MKRPWQHALLGALMILGSLLWIAPQAQGTQSGGNLSASTAVLEQVGTIGYYEVPDASNSPSVICNYKADASQVYVAALGTIKAQRKSYALQKFSVQKFLMQRLANGNYTTVASSIVQNTTTSDTGPTLLLQPQLADDFPVGPDYVVAAKITWHRGTADTVLGSITLIYSNYKVWIGDSYDYQYLNVCSSPFRPVAQPSATSGTVNSTLNYTIKRFPLKVTVSILWDGVSIGSVLTSSQGTASSNFKIPAAPMGLHTIKWKYSSWDVSKSFTIKPRIKLIPSDLDRDQTVNVSLRGFAKQEVVRIRWKKGDTWVQIAQVTTSNTGSANIDVKVPKFVPDGSTSVRGDSVNASGGHAQTNAVTVSGGPFVPAAVKTPTPTPSVTSIPATATPSPEPTMTSSPSATIPATVDVPAETPSPTASVPVDGSPVPIAP